MAGNDIPEYRVKREDIIVIFQSSYSMSTQDNTQDKDLTDKEKRILIICKKEKVNLRLRILWGTEQ